LISSVKDHKPTSNQPSSSTQGTVFPSTSQILSLPKIQIAVVTNVVVNRMDAIVVARYASLILPQVLYAFPPNDYMKYLTRFNAEGEVIVEDHLNFSTVL
jgi:hypothetical protein